MAYWFHRNPLKATGPVTFELRGAATNGQAQKICSELRQSRNLLLDIISNPNNEVTTLANALNNYLGLLHGFVVSLDDEKSGDSKLRHALRFRWTNTLLGNTPTEQYDVAFERINMLFNAALWYMKHSVKFAALEEPKMEEAKEVHKCLRTAAGIFTAIKNDMVAQLIESAEKSADLDPRVLDTYIHQCTAEAQEECSLKALADKVALKWQKYLQFKAEIYLAYAYNYHGETLLAQDKCGDAIKCLEESQSHYGKAGVLAKEYASTKGPGTSAKPLDHLFFRKLSPIVQRTLDKCVRENGFIYHQKVPPVAPDLELKATFGLAAPEEFKLPEPNAQWTADVYKAFDITKMPSRNEKAPQKDGKPGVQDDGAGSGELPPVKEADVSQSDKDPNTFSGCIVS